jgi:hypothetical protein
MIWIYDLVKEKKIRESEPLTDIIKKPHLLIGGLRIEKPEKTSIYAGQNAHI